MSESNGSQDWADKKVFTTGEAAQVCKVSQQTIIRCFDAGRLNGFRVPGSRFRRIPREELLRFMQDNDIPTTLLEAGPRRVLIVDDDPEIVGLMTEWLEADGRFEVRSAGTGYDAGMETERFRPALIVLDYMLPDINGNVVCRRVRGTPELAGTKVLCVSGVVEAAEIQGLRESGADDFMHKPFDLKELVRRIETLLDMQARAGA